MDFHDEFGRSLDEENIIGKLGIIAAGASKIAFLSKAEAFDVEFEAFHFVPLQEETHLYCEEVNEIYSYWFLEKIFDVAEPRKLAFYPLEFPVHFEDENGKVIRDGLEEHEVLLLKEGTLVYGLCPIIILKEDDEEYVPFRDHFKETSSSVLVF